MNKAYDDYSWFDPKNPNHIKAYKMLSKTGEWDEGFCPRPYNLGVAWQVMIAFKLAEEYVDLMIKEL